MSIAVIIPTIPERADLLRRAIASVSAQTLQPDERKDLWCNLSR